MSHYKNIESIKDVYHALDKYGSEVVFVGGAVVSLYADRITEEVRPTEDIDVLVEIYTPVQYGQFEEKLRRIGFTPDKEAAFIGRFKINDITVDIMPVEGEKILGFSNVWYKQAFQNAVEYAIDKDTGVKILPAPWFIATKLEAFKSRGKNDGRTSEDFEDIVFILQNRNTVWKEMGGAPADLKIYLRQEFTLLLSNKYIEEWIAAHSSPSAAQTILFELAAFTEE